MVLKAWWGDLSRNHRVVLYDNFGFEEVQDEAFPIEVLD